MTAPPRNTAPEDFRPGGRTRIIDRRGRTLPACEPDDLPPWASAELRAAVRRANAHRWRPMLYTTLFMLAGSFLGNTTNPGPLTAGKFIAALLMLGIWLGLSVLLTVGQARQTGRAALAQCLHARVCPSCGYNLAAVAPDADALTTCPECGGAWPAALGPPPESVLPCPRCRYDLAGLTPDSTGRVICPECGRSTPAPRPAAQAPEAAPS